jgi:hypothetical protein
MNPRLTDAGPAVLPGSGAPSRAHLQEAPVTDRMDDESLARAWSTALHLRQQIAATAASIAETEEGIADTLDRLARLRPHDAERLRARAAHARLFAARERAQAALYRAGPGSIPAEPQGPR